MGWYYASPSLHIEREREHIFFFLTNDPLQNRSYFRPSSAKLRGESWFFSYGTVKIHFKNPLDSSKNTSRAVESSPWLLLRCHCTQVPHIPWSRYILRHGKSDKGVVSLGGRCLWQESPCLMHTNPGSFPYNHRFTNGHWEQCLTESKTSNSCLGWFDSKATNQSPFSPSHGALNSPKKYEVRRRQTVNVHNLRSKKLSCRIRPSIPLWQILVFLPLVQVSIS